MAEVLTQLFLVVLLMVVIAAVVCRLTLGVSIVWAEELARDLLLWIVFLGAGLAEANRSHVGLGLSYASWPKVLRVGVPWIVYGALWITLATLLIVGLRFALLMWPAQSLLLPVSTGAVYLCIPIGALVVLANAMSNIGQAR
jgi:TRAP-type C4-dicarboxylate transport system permease small subunit